MSSDPIEDEGKPATVERLLAMLDIERLDRDLFRARVPTKAQMGGGRLFGGQVAAQTLRAATLTVEVDHHPHSLHGYFLRPGQPDVPLILQVDRIRAGRSFTTRNVKAIQDGEAIFALSCSFHTDEDGGDYVPTLTVGRDGDVPDPDDPDDERWNETVFTAMQQRSPFEVKEIKEPGRDERGEFRSTRRVWARTRGALPDDRAVHACVATFYSDMGAVYAAARSVGAGFGDLMGASLDHAMWFHRPLRMDEWTLYDLVPVSAGGARGLSRGAMYHHDGTIGISVAQEALIRPLNPARAGSDRS